jgi:hypothetical protein
VLDLRAVGLSEPILAKPDHHGDIPGLRRAPLKPTKRSLAVLASPFYGRSETRIARLVSAQRRLRTTEHAGDFGVGRLQRCQAFDYFKVELLCWSADWSLRYGLVVTHGGGRRVVFRIVSAHDSRSISGAIARNL